MSVLYGSWITNELKILQTCRWFLHVRGFSVNSRTPRVYCFWYIKPLRTKLAKHIEWYIVIKSGKCDIIELFIILHSKNGRFFVLKFLKFLESILGKWRGREEAKKIVCISESSFCIRNQLRNNIALCHPTEHVNLNWPFSEICLIFFFVYVVSKLSVAVKNRSKGCRDMQRKMVVLFPVKKLCWLCI